MAARAPLKRMATLRKVKYGASDMMVTEVCAGTMNWGSFNADEAEAHAQLDALVGEGVNFFDTAELYPVGWNYGRTTETWMGNWLAARTESGAVRREDLYFATKCNTSGKGGTIEPWEAHGYDAGRLRASCEASIKRLRCGALDLYMLHFPSRMGFEAFGWANWLAPERYEKAKNSSGDLADFERQVLAVKGLFDAKLIKHWGLSNENAFGLTMFCVLCDKHGVPRPVSCQNDFSFNNRVYEGDLAEACHHFGVVGMPYGALAGGMLTGKLHDAKYAGDRPLELTRHRVKADFQPRYACPVAMAAAAEYIALAEEYGISPTDLALAWTRDRWFNAVVVTGTTTVQQCVECCAALRLEPLPDELNAKIDAIHERYRSPSAALCSKSLVMAAPWLDDGGAKKRRTD